MPDSMGFIGLHNTDSVFVTGIDRDELDDLLVELSEHFDEVLQEQFGCKEHFIELEYEKKFKRLLYIKKKNYVGQLVELDNKPTDKFIIKGLECIKRDTIPLAKKWQYELVQSIIKEDHTADYYAKWIEDRKSDFYANNFEY